MESFNPSCCNEGQKSHLEVALVKNHPQDKEVVSRTSGSEVTFQRERDGKRDYVCFCGLRMSSVDMVKSHCRENLSNTKIMCDAIEEWMSDRISWDLESDGEGKLALRMLGFENKLN
ncbi:MAG: hypothetical protein JOS17DRAFT_775982 [Linnemannia elongata]|nr:MAG: hypothetical protein JOS17DRAFT_775982 [Linnemannia elongata]